ncbi:MAG: cobyrinate a,c-diamide synthase [Pseudomonadota bacterium]
MTRGAPAQGVLAASHRAVQGGANARCRGLVIAAPSSNSGKTTITLGLCRALKKSGIVVQPYKCGPDYIDPAHHSVAAGRTSYNLDNWAMSPELLTDLVARGHDADVCLAEGVMGLFDGSGSDGRSGTGSTADLAAFFGWPVVLVVDVSGQTETAAAVALGCARYRDDVTIAGVILNQVAGERHERLVRTGFERVGLPVLGSIPRGADLKLPERHLGLVQAVELAASEGDRDYIDAIADTITQHVDLDALMRLAGDGGGRQGAEETSTSLPFGMVPPGQRIAIAKDDAFSFMYPHIISMWRAMGAQVSFFSPLADERPASDADAVWLPGGYPELFAGRLAAASHFQTGLRDMAARSLPIHGECGGYMVLGRALEDGDGTVHHMVGLLDLETSYQKRRLHLGYRIAKLTVDSALGARGQTIIGHEFHYASTVTSDGDALVDCKNARGDAVTEAGSVRGSVSGTFFHAIDAL